MKKILYILPILLTAVSCLSDINDEVLGNDVETLTVSLDPETKVQLNDEGKTTWTKGDLLSVYNFNDKNVKWTFDGNTGDRSGSISKSEDVAAGEAIDKIVALYPYNASYTINSSENTISGKIAAKQTYLANSYALGENVMISAGTSTNLTMRNVLGYIQLNLVGTGTVKEIVLKGNNNEQLNGAFTINYEDPENPVAVFSSPSVTTNNKKITLDCGTKGVKLDPKKATTFIFAVLPQTFAKGFNVTVTGTDKATFTQNTTKEQKISRNEKKIFPEFTFNQLAKPGNIQLDLRAYLANRELEDVRSVLDLGVENSGYLMIAYDMETVFAGQELPEEFKGYYYIYSNLGDNKGWKYKVIAKDSSSGVFRITVLSPIGDEVEVDLPYSNYVDDQTPFIFDGSDVMITEGPVTVTPRTTPCKYYKDGM